MRTTDPALLAILALLVVVIVLVASLVELVQSYTDDSYVYFDDEDQP